MANKKDFHISTSYYAGKKVKMAQEYTGPGGHVDVPEGVTEIGQYAFAGYGKLTSVTILAEWETVDKHLFKDSSPC